MIKVIQWATGSMGRTALRRIIDHADLELVGVYVYDGNKVGLDAGTIAKRPVTGILATNDIDAILALDADVVLHTPRITLPYMRQNTEVEQLLASGKNVVSIAGFHYPQAHVGPYSDRLLSACCAGGSTLAGMGLNPGFVGERLVPLLTGLCAKLASISSHEMVEASAMPSPQFVFDTMGFGSDPAQCDITRGPLADLYGELYRETFACVAVALGTSIARLEPDHRLTLAPENIRIAAGTIPRGRVAATEWCWHAEFVDGRRMSHSLLWTADTRLHGAKADGTHWQVELGGRPNVKLSLDISDPDPDAPPNRAASDATVAIAIRSIPDICAAPPGFFTYPALAPFRERF